MNARRPPAATLRGPVLGALVLAVLLAGLAACQDDEPAPDWPDDAVVAYVGDVEITEAQVDAVVDDLRAELGGDIESELAELAEDEDVDAEELADHEQRKYGQLDDQLAVTRTRVIEMRILTEAAIWYAAREGLDEPDVPETAVKQQAHELGLSVDNAYVGMVTDFKARLSVLQSVSGPAAPTEDDQREVYDHLVEEGLTTTSFEQARAALTKEVIGEPVGMRNLLAEVVGQADVRVNPRYDLVYRVPVPVGGGESWLDLPLGGSG